MNWKLLLIALSLIASISARPAEENAVPEVTTEKVVPKTTLLVENISTTTESIVRKQPEKTTATVPEISSTTVASDRYLKANMLTKPTNARSKYVNNYANLITKHTLNNNRITNINRNITSNNSSSIVTLHGASVESSLPSAMIASSAGTSNSSSKPLVFVDADSVKPTTAIFPTTLRAFIPLEGNGAGTWSNYNLESPKVIPTKIKNKPVIHKIISKWSDNPNDVFNMHGQHSMVTVATTQQTQIDNLKQQLIHNAFSPGVELSIDQLPLIGQQLLQEHTPISIYRPTSSSLVTNFVNILNKRPTEFYDDSTKKKCKNVKINLNSQIGNVNEVLSSKEICNDININIDHKIDNSNLQPASPDVTYDIPNNDKFEDSTSDDYESDEKQEGIINVSDDRPSFVNSISQLARPPNIKGSTSIADVKFGDKDKLDKKKKKKKPSSASQLDGTDADLDDGGTSMGSMVMTMMTMMAIFNPLNLGVWGIIMAPMAAMLFGGVCFAMYQFMNHPMAKTWSAHSDPGWPKPQEIIIKNKIKHSPIPIRVMHLHKHSSGPQKVNSQPIEIYRPPPITSQSPMKNYGPPKGPTKSYGEPPTYVDSYHPLPPSGGPYRRQFVSFPARKQKKPTKNSYKFKLL